MPILPSLSAFISTSLPLFSSPTATKSRFLSRIFKTPRPEASMPKHQAKRQGGKPPPTHFLCFPLVTDESVRQLTDSLAYFRSVTTRLPESDRNATPEREGSNGDG